eukprot:TRINITY_DN4949_c0_g1_i1.p1 TRINITY_DN4949_c0_g1~~TRINITY_DN4949_c0_g1_i1.p1  ORF type:complete len:466 (+),score=102.21 TRINITY_DN4949_c0_g1_i1:77-1474(+)
MAAEEVKKLRKAAFKSDMTTLKELKAIQEDTGKVPVNEGNYDKRTALHVAAAHGLLPVVQFLIENLKCDMNVEDRFGGTPLDDAIRNKHKAVGDYLTKKGASIGKCSFVADDSGVLCDAASRADLKLLRVLAKRGVDMNQGDYDMRTAIHLATSEGKLKVVQCLVEELNANINVLDRWSGSPLDDALRTGKANVFKYLKSKGAQSGKQTTVTTEDATALCDCASSGNTDRLKQLADKGLDINMADYDARTAIHLAASEGIMLVMTFLVEELGASCAVADRYGGTPLDDAIRSGHEAVVEYLREKGGPRGKTAYYMKSGQMLYRAGSLGNLARIKGLVESKVDVNDSNADKRTALHLAAAEGHTACVQGLIDELGAEVNCEDRWGGTPLDDATFGNHQEIIDYLESKGGERRRPPLPEGEEVDGEEEEEEEEAEEEEATAEGGDVPAVVPSAGDAEEPCAANCNLM